MPLSLSLLWPIIACAHDAWNLQVGPHPGEAMPFCRLPFAVSRSLRSDEPWDGKPELKGRWPRAGATQLQHPLAVLFFLHEPEEAKWNCYSSCSPDLQVSAQHSGTEQLSESIQLFKVSSRAQHSNAFHSKALFSSKKFCKIFQIFRHIESLDVCMEY